MSFEEVYGEYQNLKENLLSRKDVLIKRDVEQIEKLDKELIKIMERINNFDISCINDFTEEQKQNLKTLGKEIKKLKENNEMLIKHILGVINNTLFGILNIIQKDNGSYNSKGMNCTNEDEVKISSIVEDV